MKGVYVLMQEAHREQSPTASNHPPAAPAPAALAGAPHRHSGSWVGKARRRQGGCVQGRRGGGGELAAWRQDGRVRGWWSGGRETAGWRGGEGSGGEVRRESVGRGDGVEAWRGGGGSGGGCVDRIDTAMT
ncbi:hypothetical protein SETIT_8G108500v2 [Setaria italica]|uniref:Uncharacterized protein n=1 Tax=Setaria italica TaxID=4555 RepID=A0A368S6K8_SETIT|nr:hypothetical protein SETIT_8G108500v2 [Setaria italica]